MKPRFKWLSGDRGYLSYGGKWISQRLSNGEFDYWLVMELTNMDDSCGSDNEGKPTYHVSVSAVSPGEAKDELVKAFDSWGANPDEFKDNPIVQVECLHSYGVSAHLWQGTGDNARQLMKQARHEAMVSEFMFGFAMDRTVNKIGTTGWEAIKGDLTAGLRRTIESDTPEGNILAKMYGTNPEESK